MNGLHTTALIRPSFLNRLAKRKVKENGYLEVQNLLACTPILEISEGEIVKHSSEYGIALDEASPRLGDLYGDVVRYFARDMQITDEEANQLHHLRSSDSQR